MDVAISRMPPKSIGFNLENIYHTSGLDVVLCCCIYVTFHLVRVSISTDDRNVIHILQSFEADGGGLESPAQPGQSDEKSQQHFCLCFGSSQCILQNFSGL